MIIPVKKKNKDDDTKLPDIVVAAYDGDTNLVSRLLDEGADPNSLDTADNLTLLHIACMQGDMSLVQVLLAHDRKYGNIDFEVKSHFRPRLAWQFAANGNFLDIATLVHSAGNRTTRVKSPKPDGP